MKILIIIIMICLVSVVAIDSIKENTQAPIISTTSTQAPRISIIELVNEFRASYSIAPLIKMDVLDQTAQIKACDMKDNNYFEHKDLNGNMSWNIIKANGINYTYAGENLARGYSDNISIVSGWMDSPDHRDNLLNPNFEYMGTYQCGTYIVQHLIGY